MARALLFNAYGVEGRDIGDHEVLRQLLPTTFARERGNGDADVGDVDIPEGGVATSAAYRLMHQGQTDWLELGGGITLTMATTVETLVGPTRDALRQESSPPLRARQ